MSSFPRRTCAAAALLPLLLTVDVLAAPGADPAGANAKVTIQPYDSVFKSYQAAPDETTSPDKLWRSANEAVAATAGHGGMAGMPMDMKMPMNHTMPMPKKTLKAAPKPTAPMPPGMDMHEGHKGK